MKYTSMVDMFKKSSEAFAEQPALSYKANGVFKSISYKKYYERSLMNARGLKRLGVKSGDKVTILSENNVNWVVADMGVALSGAISVPIYATNTPNMVEYVLNHSGAETIFISTRAQYEKLLEIYKNVPSLKNVISFDRFLGEPELPVKTIDQVCELSMELTLEERESLEANIINIKGDDIHTIIYTSGTTGDPKGVMLTNNNLLYDIHYGSQKVPDLKSGDRLLSFLPLSHVLERAAYYLAIMIGCDIAFAESIEKVPENMIESKPNIIFSVPRMFEKIHSRILENVHQLPTMKAALFHWGLRVGIQYVRKKYVEKVPVGSWGWKYKIADKLIFSKLRARFGGNIKFMISGGAPLDKEINEFFWAIGMPIFEGYGLTETSPLVCINSMDDVIFGTVGTALESVEFKLAEDGELFIKGPMVMKGYYKNETATADTFEDGWFKTGDIAEISNGFVKIVDRKKEIIVTAGGKNIAPQPIENKFKLDKFISQIYLHGDKKSYLVALIVPNMERVVEYARERHLNYVDIEDLVGNKKVIRVFEHRVDELNKSLAKYETIKKFILLPRDFTIADGELTPTLKLKRRVIYNNHKQQIECLYASDGNAYSCGIAMSERVEDTKS